MQHGQKRCVRVVGERLAQGQRAMRAQLGHEPIRQAPGGILIRLVGHRIRLARATRRPANREHGPLHGPVRSGSFSIRARFQRRGRREILRAHEAALDLRRPGCVKADEGAAEGNHLQVEPNRRSSNRASACSISPKRASTSSGSSSTPSYSASSSSYSRRRAS